MLIFPGHTGTFTVKEIIIDPDQVRLGYIRYKIIAPGSFRALLLFAPQGYNPPQMLGKEATQPPYF